MRTSRILSLAVIAYATTFTNPGAAADVGLTDDDGWNAPGIEVMRTALRAAGPSVTLTVPLTDQVLNSKLSGFTP